MKSKLCWIPFIFFSLTAIVFLILQNFSLINLQDNQISYVALGSMLAMFVTNIVFVAIDKETSPVYLISRNITAAVFAILAATFVASKATLNAILNIQSGVIDLFVIITSLFGLLAAISLVIIALSHIQGKNFLPNIAVFFLSIPIWCGLMVIDDFLRNRIISVNVINPLTIFLYSFMMIYFFKLSMVITTVDGKNPVKSMFLYGFPLAGIGLVIGAKGVASLFLGRIDYSENIVQLSCLAIAVYIIITNIELTRNMKTKDEQIVKYDLDEFEKAEDLYGGYGANSDDVIVRSENTTDDYDYSLVGAEADSFVRAPESIPDDNYEYGYDPENYDYGLVTPPDLRNDYDDDAIYVDSSAADSFLENTSEETNIAENTTSAADYPEQSVENSESPSESDVAEQPVNLPNEPIIVSKDTSSDDETIAKIDRLIADMTD